jgi:hypothetical protein
VVEERRMHKGDNCLQNLLLEDLKESRSEKKALAFRWHMGEKKILNVHTSLWLAYIFIRIANFHFHLAVLCYMITLSYQISLPLKNKFVYKTVICSCDHVFRHSYVILSLRLYTVTTRRFLSVCVRACVHAWNVSSPWTHND